MKSYRSERLKRMDRAWDTMIAIHLGIVVGGFLATVTEINRRYEQPLYNPPKYAVVSEAPDNVPAIEYGSFIKRILE